MSSKSARKISRKSVRNLLTWSHYRFAQHLKQAANRQGVLVVRYTPGNRRHLAIQLVALNFSLQCLLATTEEQWFIYYGSRWTRSPPNDASARPQFIRLVTGWEKTGVYCQL